MWADLGRDILKFDKDFFRFEIHFYVIHVKLVQFVYNFCDIDGCESRKLEAITFCLRLGLHSVMRRLALLCLLWLWLYYLAVCWFKKTS